MQKYTVLIFLPVAGWRAKLLDIFVSLGWKVSAASGDGILRGEASAALNFHIECALSDNDEIRKKVQELLSEHEIYYFGIVIWNRDNNILTWSPSNSKVKIQQTVYRN